MDKLPYCLNTPCKHENYSDGSIRGAWVDGQWLSWHKIRMLVLKGDFMCCICGNTVRDQFEVGHIISRMYGGSDHPDNLAIMCTLCNRLLNPEHETAESFWQWVETKPAITIANRILSGLSTDDILALEKHFTF